MRMHDSSERTDHSSPSTRGKRRFDDDADTYSKRGHRQQLEVVDETPDDGHRWSTWDQSTPTEKGPLPHPDWLVTELAAVDVELGVLKTGKEADVFLVERGVPDTDRRCLLAAKRYRASEHRMFHRDAGYLEGRRVKESRVNRAMAARTDFGRQVIAGQWARLSSTRCAGCTPSACPCHTPSRSSAPRCCWSSSGRLTARRPHHAWLSPPGHGGPGRSVGAARRRSAHHGARRLRPWRPVRVQPARPGWPACSHRPAPDRGRGGEPQGQEFLGRDARNVATWFTSHGVRHADGDELARDLLASAGMR